MKRFLKTTALVLLVLSIVMVGVLSWMIGTERGFQQTLALAKKFAPGTLAWEEAEGTLAGPLQIRGLTFSQSKGVEANVGEIVFDWHPSALFGAELVVEQLHVDDIDVYLAQAGEQAQAEVSSSAQLPDISLPVSVKLNDIAINNVAVYPAGQEEPIVINRVAFAGGMDQSEVQLVNLDVVAPQGELSVEGYVITRDHYPMNLVLNWEADLGLTQPLQGSGKIAGDLARLQIEHQLSGLAVAEISVIVNDAVQTPAWDATIQASLPEPALFSPLVTGKPQITLQSTGTPDDYKAQVLVNLSTTETGPLSVDMDLTGSSEKLDINSLVTTFKENSGELTAAGNVVFASLQSELRGRWQSLSWPMLSDPQLSSDTGSFELSGTPDNFIANLALNIDGATIPEGEWAASLEGSSTSLSDFSVQGQTLGGSVKTSGSASWESQPEWDLQLVTQGIDPGTQWSDFPGSLDLDIRSTGQISDNGPQLVASINALSGNLRDQPLAGGGSIRLAGKTLNIDELRINHGLTAVNATGQIDDEIVLEFDFDSPDLAVVLPDLTGAVSIAGNVAGSQHAPTLKASGSATGISYAATEVSALDFSVDTGLAPDVVSSLSLSATGIVAGGQQITDLTINGNGSQGQHSLAVSADTDQGDVIVQLDGGYQESAWNGTLSSLQLVNSLAGNWGLREPVAISVDTENADVAQLCLDNQDNLGGLCVSSNWRAAGKSTVTAIISGLSPELVGAYLPAGFNVETELNGDAVAFLSADGAMTADVALELEPGRLVVDGNGSPIEIGLEKTTLDATLRNEDASVVIDTTLSDLGSLNVDASIADFAGRGQLAGNLHADFPDLTLISAFAPQIQQVAGALTSKLSLGGTLQTPRIEGELALLDFSAEIPETAMVIEDTQLRVTGNPDGTLRIEGQSRSGGGQLGIQGSIDPGTKALDLVISGNDYQVANSNVMQAVVSPQLNVSMDNTGMTVTGEVTIPSVYINANGGNEGIKTVSSSSDVVFVSEETEVDNAPQSQLNLDVKIVLGDSVEVEAGDFRGRLEGDLRVQQTPELAPRGTGTITVLNGDYVIYGQQLNMERGRILFSGGPVDNPALDMEVARTVQEYDVVAGAKIQGTAQAPRLELYSEPPMPDASILSFILLGQPPGTTGGSYTLGKYLTPDLYVSYGIGLFDAINTFNMRYSLTDRLVLEAASGSGSSADLIFTIEK